MSAVAWRNGSGIPLEAIDITMRGTLTAVVCITAALILVGLLTGHMEDEISAQRAVRWSVTTVAMLTITLVVIL